MCDFEARCKHNSEPGKVSVGKTPDGYSPFVLRKRSYSSDYPEGKYPFLKAFHNGAPHYTPPEGFVYNEALANGGIIDVYKVGHPKGFRREINKN